MGRFLNADIFASTGQGFIGNNMFSYCGNNPVIHCDPTGNALDVALGRLFDWIFGDGEKEDFDDRSTIAQKIKESELMSNIVDDAYEQFKITGETYFEGDREFTPDDSLDLYLSLQHFHYTITFSTKKVTEKYL